MAEVKILISAEELHSHLGDSDWAIIDCRFDLADPHAGQRAYRLGHIRGSIFLDLDKDLAGPITAQSGRHPLPDHAVLARRLGERGIRSTQHIVVYDDGPGAVAARAWWLLRWLGCKTVYVLDGGLARWESLELPLASGEAVVSPTSFVVGEGTGRILETSELSADVFRIPELNLLDARDEVRFRGESEPIDPVAGHIPGAINAPFADFVRQDGTWRPLAERAALLEKALGSDRSVDWSVMCGSGVTACHLAISGLEAGYLEPRLYVGSWSEWIRDPRRPISTESS